jgi:hypothetical protein
MANKVFTTGNAYGGNTEYRVYEDGKRIRTEYDYSGDMYKNLMYDDYVHGYTTAQVAKAKEELRYWKELVEMMEKAPIVEDNEEFLGDM